MSAKLIFRDQEFEVEAGKTIRDAIKECGLSPETVLPVRDGELVTDDVLLEEGDVITLVAVISGG
ncbi:MAG TPA: MoaD/ThiS family protein [Chloroflexi bacterium]|nr:MoaD/ThiS family protein [Chloroflexota bacterium]